MTEEQCRIAALKDETERKGRAMKETVEELTAQIALLCNSIAVAERQAEAHNLTVQVVPTRGFELEASGAQMSRWRNSISVDVEEVS